MYNSTDVIIFWVVYFICFACMCYKKDNCNWPESPVWIPCESIDIIFLEHWCLVFSFSLFFIGIFGIIFSRKNLINVMISIELMLLGACLNFIFFSIFLDSMIGQMFALIVIALAAADSAVGLGILIAAFYLKRNISFESFSFLKG